jgi:lysyl-tRNA synthetase class 2
MDLEMLQERARIIRRVRSFFDGRDYHELDTPLLSPDLIPESCLEVFETRRMLPTGMSVPYWLVPSPEIYMKPIIARHKTSVYQICKCFRNGESSGFLHNPEFTMLEYYTMEADYLDSLALTEELCVSLANSPDSAISVPFYRLTVAEAFARYAGFDLFAAAEKPGGLETEARRLGLEPVPGTETAVLYDLIFIHAVEPHLKQNRPVALLDYPAFVPCLARRNPEPAAEMHGSPSAGTTVQRWELYYNGIELANCFTEETDPEQVRNFFLKEAEAKKCVSLVQHRVNHDYWKHFRDFPACSGVALGLDRLIMALCGRSTIDGVLPFPMD